MRYFNTSGPNIPEEHYTLQRKDLIIKGIKLVQNKRYFTIWAPRQTGKSTYFRQLAKELGKIGYKVAHINFENYRTASLDSFLYRFIGKLKEFWKVDFSVETEISKVFNKIEDTKDNKFVLIIDEVEGINPEYFGEFLHSIRNAYHSRENHCLKSVILVGVSNIVGIISDNASPFNIADNLDVPYFTNEETFELLHQHETETGQLFDKKVKQKITEITANQPGLVNGFAKKLVDDHPDKPEISYDDYLKVEHWYLNIAIDKNFANILNKARQHRSFIERLLFTEDTIPFDVDRETVKILHTNGLLKEDNNGNIKFWVPFYKKRLSKAFYPYSNGETKNILRSIIVSDLFFSSGQLNIGLLVNNYKEYVKRRGFNAWREKDETGNYKSIKEAALIYSFETYIQAFLQMIKAKSYREADTGLGKSDLIVNIKGDEYLFESKIYYYESRFLEGMEQLAYYCNSLGLKHGVYLVFIPNNIRITEAVKDQNKTINNVEIETFLVPYDEEKDF